MFSMVDTGWSRGTWPRESNWVYRRTSLYADAPRSALSLLSLKKPADPAVSRSLRAG